MTPSSAYTILPRVVVIFFPVSNHLNSDYSSEKWKKKYALPNGDLSREHKLKMIAENYTALSAVGAGNKFNNSKTHMFVSFNKSIILPLP